MSEADDQPTQVGGIDQIQSEGFYRIASGFYALCQHRGPNGIYRRVLVFSDEACRNWVGEARYAPFTSEQGGWRWRNAQVNESGIGHTVGPELDLATDMYGRLHPPIPAPAVPDMPGHVQGLEQLEQTGVYRLAGRFMANCVAYPGKGLVVFVINHDYRLLGVAQKDGVLWSWRSAIGDGTSSAHTDTAAEDLIKVDGHLLPPIDTPKWSQEPAAPAAGMTSMLVTEREKAAILAFRGSAPDQIAVSFYPS